MIEHLGVERLICGCFSSVIIISLHPIRYTLANSSISGKNSWIISGCSCLKLPSNSAGGHSERAPDLAIVLHTRDVVNLSVVTNPGNRLETTR